METVPSTTGTDRESEPNNYPTVAAELHRIAEAIAPLTTPGRLLISVTLMTPEGETTKQTIAGVDAAALAVLGKEGETKASGSNWFHLAQGGDYKLGVSYLCVLAKIPAPPDERDAELEKLRAEIAALRSAPASTKDATA